MARKIKQSIYGSWSDIDDAMKELAELRNDLITAETAKNERIREANALCAKITAPLKAKEKLLTAEIELFALQNRAEIDGRTKILNFGKISFRKSSRLSYPTAKVQEIIGRILLKGYDACIRRKEELDKEALEKLTDNQLEELGIKRVREESVTIDPEMGRLKNVPV